MAENIKEEIKIIHSEKLKEYPEIVFGFSTKQGGFSPAPYFLNLGASVGDDIANVNKNRDLFFGTLGIAASDVTLMNQVHSANVQYSASPQLVMDCDGVFTDKKNIFLAVSVADCIPVFLYEPEKKIAAAVHAGWKGTYAGIVKTAIDKMIEECRIDPSKIVAYIGPGISQEHYEVNEDVGKYFNDDVKEFRNGKFFIDLKKENMNQLLSKGVRKENIEVSGYCTFKDKELFHSHRRENGKTGRMFGIIGIKG